MKLSTRFKNAYKGFVGDPVQSGGLAQLLNFLGLEDTGEKELNEATYFACLKVLSEAIGKMPLKLLYYNEKNGVVNARKHELYYVIKERPNKYMNASTFWGTMEYNRNHYGNAYALIEYKKRKTQLWILDSTKIEVWYDDALLLGDNPDIYYLYSSGKNYYRFGSESIIHLKGSNSLDGIKGISVREQLKNTIKGNIKSQQLQNKMYENGFTAKAVMQYTGNLSDENVKKFIKGIEEYATGKLEDEGIRNIIPIPLGATLTPLNTKFTDAQFLELKQYTALQIASAFGIKPYQIGDYTKSSYASEDAQQLSFYVDTLLYILKQYEEELNYKLLTEKEIKQGYHFKFNVAAILRANLATQISTLSQGVSNFIYTPNEARAMLDLEAKEGGDKLLGNGASIPVDLAGIQYQEPQQIDNEEGGENNERGEDS